MLLSLVLFDRVGERYKSELPLRPDPSQNRTFPILITGSVPVYANAHERSTWDFAKYAFLVTCGLGGVIVVTAQYFKGSRKRDATQTI